MQSSGVKDAQRLVGPGKRRSRPHGMRRERERRQMDENPTNQAHGLPAVDMGTQIHYAIVNHTRADDIKWVHHFLVRFWTFLSWSLEFLYVPPFLYGTLLVILNVIVASLRQKPFVATCWKQHYSWTILQFLFFPATLAVAVIGQVDWQQAVGQENVWGLRATDAFLFGSLLTGTCGVWKMKGVRWFAAGLAILQVWVLAGAQFVAGMALSGRWL
jgi:hypothetical protein